MAKWLGAGWKEGRTDEWIGLDAWISPLVVDDWIGWRIVETIWESSKLPKTQQMDPWRGESCRLKVHFIALFFDNGWRSSFPPARCLCVTAIELLLPALNFEKQKMARRFVRFAIHHWYDGGMEEPAAAAERAPEQTTDNDKKKRPKWVSSAIFLSVVKGEEGWIPTMHSFIHSTAAEWINDTKGGCSADLSSLVCIFVQ